MARFDVYANPGRHASATSVERLAVERGMAQGMAQGKAAGRIETLTRQLTRRFGPLPEWATERLGAANPEQLDRWTDLVLDADSLAEVLGEH